MQTNNQKLLTYKSVDHIYPTSRGGKNTPLNKVLACIGCNHLKGNRTLDEFKKFLQDAINWGGYREYKNPKLRFILGSVNLLIDLIEPYKNRMITTVLPYIYQDAAVKPTIKKRVIKKEVVVEEPKVTATPTIVISAESWLSHYNSLPEPNFSYE
jgi:hypothetical protein